MGLSILGITFNKNGFNINNMDLIINIEIENKNVTKPTFISANRHGSSKSN